MTSHKKSIFRIVSYAGLLLSILPAVLVFQETISRQLYFQLMFLGMLLWFGSAVWWIRPDHLGK